ncbi:glycine-rich protein family [Actinidia rufa]|uniref:Glycine-rich protein family n=1 Tax=Actinidia rufa TaxID=165716 RepID=A0A7J0FS14_9ERIC|nr:glycine-rich protein family [Actinidia rufa]
MSLIQAWSYQRKPFRASHLSVPDMPWDRAHTLSRLDLAWASRPNSGTSIQLRHLDLAQVSQPSSVCMSWINAYRGHVSWMFNVKSSLGLSSELVGSWTNSTHEKPSRGKDRSLELGELGTQGARRALSKRTTFVGESSELESSLQMDNLHEGELGTHGSSGSSLPMENLRQESSELGELSPNGQPSWGELGTQRSSESSLPMENFRRGELRAEGSWESSLQMDNLCGGELGTHGSSGSSLPMENFRRESSELGELSLNGQPSWGRACTHGSSRSSLPMKNICQESSELGELKELSPNGQSSWGRAWYSRELGKLSPNEKLSSGRARSWGELGELSPNGQPLWGRAWYSRELEKLSPNGKPSLGELGAGKTRIALSKWITFVGESLLAATFSVQSFPLSSSAATAAPQNVGPTFTDGLDRFRVGLTMEIESRLQMAGRVRLLHSSRTTWRLTLTVAWPFLGDLARSDRESAGGGLARVAADGGGVVRVQQCLPGSASTFSRTTPSSSRRASSNTCKPSMPSHTYLVFG